MLGRAVVVLHIDIWLVLHEAAARPCQHPSNVRSLLLPNVDVLCLLPPNVSVLCLREVAALAGQLSDAHDRLVPVVFSLVLDRKYFVGVSLAAQLRDALSVALVDAPVAPFLHLSLAVAPSVPRVPLAPFVPPFVPPSLHLSRVVAPDVHGLQLGPELRVLPFCFFPDVLSL